MAAFASGNETVDRMLGCLMHTEAACRQPSSAGCVCMKVKEQTGRSQGSHGPLNYYC